ncbi:MAG: VOC family protein [Armatimonadetes bacterium]|nr:VOC family protein [Armatimonadota bacterium]
MSATVRYIVKDVGSAVEFYVSALGFELVERFGDVMAILRLDALELWVAGPGASASRPMPNGRTPAPGGWNRIAVIVEDLDAAVSRLKELETPFRNEPVSGPGGRQVLIDDPSGNPIELFEPR